VALPVTVPLPLVPSTTESALGLQLSGTNPVITLILGGVGQSSLGTSGDTLALPDGLVQIDNDYTGRDFSASLKAFNPSCLEGGLTGILATAASAPSLP
jgi:hypothetical protein